MTYKTGKLDSMGEKLTIIVIYVFTLCLCICIFPTDLTAQPTLNWLKPKQIPLYITEGEYQGQGIMDKIIRLVQEEALSDFKFNDLWVNQKRFNVEAKKGDNCYLGWRMFPQYRYFSEPLLIWCPMGLITHKKNQQRFGQTGNILSLKKLLKVSDLKLGVLDDFAYSPDVQKLLIKNRKNPNVNFIKDLSTQVDLRLLSMDRFDYTIGWPFQPIVGERILKIPNEYLFYNIQEDQKYLYLGVSCGKSDEGRLVIEKVNELLKREDIHKKIYSFMEEWVVLSPQWQELYEETIVKKNKNPMVVHMEYVEE